MRSARSVRPAVTLLLPLLFARALSAQSYDPSGPQTDVARSTLEASHWTLCYEAPYASSTGQAFSAIAFHCPADKMMLACGDASTPSTLALLAEGPAAEVLMETGDGENDSHQVNGSTWYLDWSGVGSGSFSWGFAGPNATVSRDNCDVGTDDPGLRLCWHLNEHYGGYRCGDTTALNDSVEWTKSIFAYTSLVFLEDFELNPDACRWSQAVGWTGDCSETLTLDLDPACDSTLTDNGAYDHDPSAGVFGWQMVWNDLRNETGYRVQLTHDTQFGAEDDYVELPPGSSETPIFFCTSVENCVRSVKVIAHVGHAPGHGDTPIAGDVESNVCAVEMDFP